LLGDEENILNPTAKNANRIRLKTPILSRKEFAALTLQTKFAKPTATLPILFKAEERDGLEACLEELFEAADKKIANGAELLVLSDDGVNAEWIGIPALLAVSGLHHHFVKAGTRTKVS
ncbi:glutamate synthase central domain-containing protein, partial [Listeria innocua]|uniref:glutamate synthase central domain-containing protein n=1 Tax=Listeria innocua TaxID=1642 RepID=UPI0022707A08